MINLKTIFLNAIAIGGAVACSSCGNTAQTKNNQPTETGLEPLKWMSAPEDSFVHYFLGVDYAVRCWKKNSSNQCIQVGISNSGPNNTENFSIQRFSSKTLPTGIHVNTSKGGGSYSCEFSSSIIQEEILNGEKLLTSNIYVPGLPNELWSREYVEKYMKDNGLNVTQPFFPCHRIGGAFAAGSLATLGTTSVSWNDVIGAPHKD